MLIHHEVLPSRPVGGKAVGHQLPLARHDQGYGGGGHGGAVCLLLHHCLWLQFLHSVALLDPPVQGSRRVAGGGAGGSGEGRGLEQD